MKYRCAASVVAFTVFSMCSASDRAVAEMVALGEEFRANTIEDANQNEPAIDDTPGGGFVVVWDGSEETGRPFRGILGQRFGTDGTKVGTEFVANTPQQSYRWSQGKGDVAAQSSGGFVVVWDNFYDQDGSLQGVFAQRFDELGEKVGAEFQVNTYTMYAQYDSAVATLSGGGFVVTWMDTGYFGATGTNIFAQRFNEQGVQSGSEFQVPESTVGSPVIPAIADIAANRFVVTWSSRQGDNTRGIRAQLFNASGDRIGQEIQVDSFTAGTQRNPDVSGRSPTGFVIAWESYANDGDGFGIFAQRFDEAGETVGTEFQVNQYTTGAQERPAVAVAVDGSFVVAWSSDGQDGDGRGVFGRRFLSDATADGDEFQANTYTTGIQGGRLGEGVDVAIDESGRIFVVWQSEFQDADRDSIIGRLYCVDPPTGAVVCGDATCVGASPSATINATDASATLQAAVGIRACDACRCDVNASGFVTAVDAQRILYFATGQPLALNCPACG